MDWYQKELLKGAKRGIASGFAKDREAETDRIMRPKSAVRRMLTTEMVIEWSVRGDTHVMDQALPYLQQGMFHSDAFKLVCHHLVSGSAADYYCTTYLLDQIKQAPVDCAKWRELSRNIRQTTLLYTIARFVLADCEQEAALA